MDVHEYQAKEILAAHGVAIPPGTIAFSPDQAVYAATELREKKMMKALLFYWD